MNSDTTVTATLTNYRDRDDIAARLMDCGYTVDVLDSERVKVTARLGTIQSILVRFPTTLVTYGC